MSATKGISVSESAHMEIAVAMRLMLSDINKRRKYRSSPVAAGHSA